MAHSAPDIYLFNPTCEMAVANGNPSWQPNRNLKQLEEDLSFLPAFLAKEKDIVLSRHAPSDTFYRYYAYIDFNFPKFYTGEALLSELAQKKFIPGEIIPWGHSPAVEQRLKKAYPYFPKNSIYQWNPKLRDFYSREFALNILLGTLDILNSSMYLGSKNMPRVCTSPEELNAAHQKNQKSITKMPWSSSGRGIQIINRPDLHSSILQKLKGAIKQQGKVIIEPLLNKKLDFALHYKISPEAISYMGLSVFDTAPDGQYSGNYLNGFVPQGKEPYHSFLISELKHMEQAHIQVLRSSGLTRHYSGYIGIDGLVFEENGNLKIQPCLEINLRYNMGTLALQLENLLHESSYGVFCQYGPAKGSFEQLMLKKKLHSPLVCKNGKVVKGSFPLTHFDKRQLFGAYVDVFEK